VLETVGAARAENGSMGISKLANL